MNERINSQDWLGAGLRTLAAEGPQGLRIMAIAQQLGVTKGSFYWHYRDLEQYQAALLQEWEQRHTLQVILEVEGAGGDAAQKLRNLLAISFGADARLAQAIRQWATTNAQVREAQVRVDGERLDYVVSLLRPLGWTQARAQFLARWMYSALIGHFSLQGPPVQPGQIDMLLDVLTPAPAKANGKR